MMFNKFSFKKNESQMEADKELDLNRIPSHIAIIMDGNGRWAKKRGLPRVAGHYEGMNVVRKVVKYANQLGCKVLTLYAFSTENWKRPKTEVDYLMKLPVEFLDKFLPELIEENVKVQIMGNREQLPEHTLKAVDYAINKTKDNNGIVLNFALNYGSRDEIVQATKNIANDVKNGQIDVNNINDTVISKYMMTSELPDPDLLIRTSGEIRLSNFMLWQLAYTEFYFTNVYWPDFKEDQLAEAIKEYQKRGRRFGGV